MGALSDAARQAVCDELARQVSAIRGSLGNLTKAQLKAAFDAADTWVDSNAASFNSALPAAARSALTASQKALILQLVVERRYRDSANG